jgi:hypothetical protein
MKGAQVITVGGDHKIEWDINFLYAIGEPREKIEVINVNYDQKISGFLPASKDFTPTIWKITLKPNSLALKPLYEVGVVCSRGGVGYTMPRATY